jgi:hypothetical protein
LVQGNEAYEPGKFYLRELKPLVAVIPGTSVDTDNISGANRGKFRLQRPASLMINQANNHDQEVNP